MLKTVMMRNIFVYFKKKPFVTL